MPHRKPLAAIFTLASVCLLLVVVPRWTARKVEQSREQSLRLLAASPDAVASFDCPIGDDLDRFLQSPPDSSGKLWRPACRETELRADRVIVVRKNRSEYASCREDLQHSTIATCALKEALAFLADASKPTTRARMKLADAQGRQVIWVTSEELRWNEALVSEHRIWLAMALSFILLTWLLKLSGQHARITLAEQRSRSRETNTPPPRGSEFFLLFLLPRFAADLPDDYREEYAQLLAKRGRSEAGRWYRMHVLLSLPELALMRAREIANRLFLTSALQRPEHRSR